jgi:hypothetical protein
MSEELEQVGAGAEGATEAGQTQAGSETTTKIEIPSDLQPVVQAQVAAAVEAATQKVRDEYERKDGHLAKLRSTKDRELAQLRKQLSATRKQQVEEAEKLLESNPDQAAAILKALVAEQSTQIEQDGAHDELVSWQHKVLADLGADPDEDEEAATLALEWGPKLLSDPNMTWDFQQAAAKLVLDREREATKTANKELKELKESLPDTVKAEVTKALVSAGIVPEPTDEGGAPPGDDDWRKLSSSELRRRGIAEDRAKAAKIRAQRRGR